MMENEELMQRFMYDSRRVPWDFVTRSHNIDDVIYYLRAECEFEILKLTSFVTTNLISFDKIETSGFGSHPSSRKGSIEDTFPVDNLD